MYVANAFLFIIDSVSVITLSYSDVTKYISHFSLAEDISVSDIQLMALPQS